MSNYRIVKLENSFFGRLSKTGIELSGGSRPRLYLTKPFDGQKVFLKTYSHTTAELYAEFLASKFAKLIGLRAQDAHIVVLPENIATWMREESGGKLGADWLPIGVRIDNIFPDDTEVMYAKDILGNPDKRLKLEDIERGIRQRFGEAEDIIQNYVDMVVFDALIGNMDRHHENWGVVVSTNYKSGLAGEIEGWNIEEYKGDRYFTPLFDHGSSLMFELQEFKLENMARDLKIVNHYVDRGYGFVLDNSGKKNNIFKVMHQYMHTSEEWNKRFKISIDKILAHSLTSYAEIVNRMPVKNEYGWSPLRKVILLFMTHVRYNKLKELNELKAGVL